MCGVFIPQQMEFGVSDCRDNSKKCMLKAACRRWTKKTLLLRMESRSRRFGSIQALYTLLTFVQCVCKVILVHTSMIHCAYFDHESFSYVNKKKLIPERTISKRTGIRGNHVWCVCLLFDVSVFFCITQYSKTFHAHKRIDVIVPESSTEKSSTPDSKIGWMHRSQHEWSSWIKIIRFVDDSLKYLFEFESILSISH